MSENNLESKVKTKSAQWRQKVLSKSDASLLVLYLTGKLDLYSSNLPGTQANNSGQVEARYDWKNNYYNWKADWV